MRVNGGSDEDGREGPCGSAYAAGDGGVMSQMELRCVREEEKRLCFMLCLGVCVVVLPVWTQILRHISTWSLG